MTEKAITIKDLAAKLNISVSTVSRALKDNPEISVRTRQAVQSLAKELGYKPNPLAVALKTQKSHMIGIVVPEIVNSFFATVVKAVEKVADKYGYNVLVASSSETFAKEKKNIEIFLANRMDGIILSISRDTTSYEHIKSIQEHGIPLVLFDRTTKELDVSKVIADDADAACKIVQHLIYGGAKRIALITGPEQLSIGRNRMKGYLKALTINKLEINPEYIVRVNDFSVQSAKEATSKLLNMDVKPDAIFGINDDMAIGAIEAIKEKKLRIPEDITVFGFSNSKRSRYMNPSISTVNQFPDRIGEAAAELLFEQILDPKHVKIRRKIVNSELVIRESSDRSSAING
ncbi:LacI family transcriptional regulator [Odoribacter sp. OttesenSCG-928-J03]|nr:LacI family transcriptional regulator [Odoribacter sp. OttesenSCG-928-J03]MDL2283198.1 LacI family transcriptional regulator [Odoribacter sp. OttesenSCG-928-G04]